MADVEESDDGVRGVLGSNWVGIVVAVVVLVQGVALAILATSLDTVRTAEQVALAVLAFVVVIRATQTYITAALEYGDWLLGFADLVVIFGVGVMEYRFIGAFAEPDGAHAAQRWFAVISLVGLVGYARAYWFVQHRSTATRARVRRETQLQRCNLLGTSICLLLAAVCSLSRTGATVIVVAVAMQVIVVALNTFWSLRVTLRP